MARVGYFAGSLAFGLVLWGASSAVAATAATSAASNTARAGLVQPQASDPHTPTITPVNSSGVIAATDNCAVCHRTHTASSTQLLPSGGSESTFCFTCHDGTGASTNVSSEFALANTQNDPSTASYYRHDATEATSHTLAVTDEFAGVLNRHAECGDCHNPHQSHGTAAAAETSNGWTPSYRLAGISGVAATNGMAGSTPSYSFLPGNAEPISFEYQLCFKCHSGNTILLPLDALHPSRDMLDVGAEFNPANSSFHPIEAQGKNQTAAMAASLRGASPYKAWTFSTTSTIRCDNCHANSASLAGASTPAANLPPHVSPFRGILLQNYEDRVLNGTDPSQTPQASYGYSAANFALCYLCHSDSPFVPGGTDDSATNFLTGASNAYPSLNLHRLHVTGLGALNLNPGATNDIDTRGAGNGNAICAECHFRPHSTAFPTLGQASTSRLVSFAPDVLGPDGTTTTIPTWTQSGAGGTCALTCHGFQHKTGTNLVVAYP